MNALGQEIPEWLNPENMRWCWKGGGGSQTTQTVQKNEPWPGQQPFLSYGFGEAQDVYKGNQPSYFPGDTITPLTPAQQMAQNAGIGRAMMGSPLVPAAQNQALQTIQGDYTQQGNPYLGGVMSNIESTVLPAIDSRFASAGRYGSGLHADTASRAATEALAPYAFNNYEAERARQANMTTSAPGLAMADYQDIGILGDIGSQQQLQGQNELNAEIERHNFEQNLEANKLAQYMGLIGGSYGGEGTSTTIGPSPGKGGSVGGLLGGAGNLLGGGAQAYGAFR